MVECGESSRRAALAARAPKTIREAPIITGKSGGIGRRLISTLLIFAVTGLVAADVAWAEPAAISKAKSEAEVLQGRIDELSEQLDAVVEDYNYAKAKLSETTKAAKNTQSKLTQAEKDLEEARNRLAERVVGIYKQGQLGMLDTLVGSNSFSDLINRLDLLERLSEQDKRVVEEVGAYRDQVSERKAELVKQLEEEKALTAETTQARKKVEERLAANVQALAGKEAQIAQLQKEEAARQAKLAAEARAAAKKAAETAARKKAAAVAAAKAKSASTSTSSGSSSGSKRVSVSVPDSASSSDVVAIAMDYLGCPYVWAGASPSGFDCSGFVMYVFRKVGVSLPHSSRMQYGCGQPVSNGDLRPGDLVFFGNPIHHVGIYIGNGKMIDAAGTGKDVRISDVWRSNYYGACRIIL
jgi:cell wall-associated NlpC family hydrolase